MVNYQFGERFNKIRKPLLSPILTSRAVESAGFDASENLIKHGGAFRIPCIRATRAQKYSVSASGRARIGDRGAPATAAAFGGWST